jgi:hypothetical protein
MNYKVAFAVLRVPAGAARSSVHLKEDPYRNALNFPQPL